MDGSMTGWLIPAWIIMAPSIAIALGASVKGTSSMGHAILDPDAHITGSKRLDQAVHTPTPAAYQQPTPLN